MTTSALGSDDDFYVVLKSPSRPAILASPDIVRITIIEDDSAIESRPVAKYDAFCRAGNISV